MSTWPLPAAAARAVVPFSLRASKSQRAAMRRLTSSCFPLLAASMQILSFGQLLGSARASSSKATFRFRPARAAARRGVVLASPQLGLSGFRSSSSRGAEHSRLAAFSMSCDALGRHGRRPILMSCTSAGGTT